MPYTCPLCNIIAYSITSLKKHFRKSHLSKCEICNYVSKSVVHHYRRLALQGDEKHLVLWYLSTNLKDSEIKEELKKKAVYILRCRYIAEEVVIS